MSQTHKVEKVDTNDAYLANDIVDEKQIMEADKEVKQALVYHHTQSNKLVITYAGVKWAVLKMADRGSSMQFIGEPQIKLEKFGLEDMKEWCWQASVKVRNINTRLETLGVAESPFIDRYSKDGKHDPFGRTKAVSKAERNAYRKQIPELEIAAVVKSAQTTGGIQQLQTTPTPASAQKGAPASASQTKYYRDLCTKHGINDSVTPSSMEAMSVRIDQIVKRYGK
ncbi:MAG: hypothetical protein K8823_1544 [Cenarchaeum symbiont of Oopsacas minuta]|nr:hypothetical protein [Cenarchaeum symbiont of Oopsacas minuta]